MPKYTLRHCFASGLDTHDQRLRGISFGNRKLKMAEADAGDTGAPKGGTTIEVKAEAPDKKKKSGCC